MANVRWPGRLEVIQQNPCVVLDGAHNPAAISVLCQSLPRLYSWRRLIIVFGVLEDKQYGVMLKKLCSLADEIILTMASTERAVSPEELLPHIATLPGKVTTIRSPIDAFKAALSKATIHDLICVTGSLYLVGEIKEYMNAI
jgi:dihydrofolate synthase/folylpolyglutamate synthase